MAVYGCIILLTSILCDIEASIYGLSFPNFNHDGNDPYWVIDMNTATCIDLLKGYRKMWLPLTFDPTMTFTVKIYTLGIPTCAGQLDMFMDEELSDGNEFVGRFRLCELDSEEASGELLVCTMQCTCSGCERLYVQTRQPVSSKARVCEVIVQP